MRLFRRSLPVEQAIARHASATDLFAVQSLFRMGGRRFYGFAPEDLPSLLATAPTALLVAPSGDLWGVMISSWRAQSTSWLRGLALAEGITPNDGVARLLPLLASQIRAQSLRQIYYAGDEAADRWLQPVLLNHGFVADIEVIVYEKRDHTVPSPGNPAIRIRPALPVDLGTILALDARCFADQWTKGHEVLGPALKDAAFFVVAELDGVPCGYAFATAHFNNRLLHLVRIAVEPSLQGRGIGVRLLAELVSVAAQHESEAITLNTQADNYQAQRLYQWFNFRPTGERQTILRYDL